MKLLPVFHLVILLMFSALVTNAQEIFQPSARYQALANTSVALADCWSVFGNQAGLAGISKSEVGGSFQNRFLVSELSSRAGLFVLPVQSSVFAVSLYQFGKLSFRHEKFGIAYARRIFPQLNFGLQFSYYRLFFSEDNRFAGSYGVELGAQYLIAKKLVLGIHLLNPFQTRIATSPGSFKYQSGINIGGFYHLSESFSLSSEIENGFNNHITVKSGIEYNLLDKLYLRAGVYGKPYQLSAGIGFQVKKLTIDMADSYHEYLGSSPSVSFQYQF